MHAKWSFVLLCAGACRLNFDDVEVSGPGFVLIGKTANAVRDCKLWADYPDYNLGGTDHQSIDIGETALVYFDLTTVPPDLAARSATLTVTTFDQSASDGGDFQIVRMREAWDEGTSSDEPGVANWVERRLGVPWTSPGAQPPSRDATPLATLSPVQLETSYSVMVPTAVVNDWIATPDENFGLAFVQGTSTSHIHLHARESGSGWATLGLDLVPR